MEQYHQRAYPNPPRRRRRRRRRRHRFLSFLLFFALCSVLFYPFFQWSNHSLQVEEFQFVSDRLPDGFDGCKAVVLSDLHGAEFGENNTDLINSVRTIRPDYIFLIGDLQDRFRETPQSYTISLCDSLAAIAPTYFVTGNHEWALGNVPALKNAIEDVGAMVLTNEFVILERDGDQIALAGIDDPNGFADQKKPKAVAEDLNFAWDDIFWVLLAHRNNYFPTQYCRLGADLVISGHAHGGLIRLPLTDGLIGVERNFFPSYTHGFYEKNNSQLFVTRGLGNSGRSFRLFNRPQIAVLTLTQGKK